MLPRERRQFKAAPREFKVSAREFKWQNVFCRWRETEGKRPNHRRGNKCPRACRPRASREVMAHARPRVPRSCLCKAQAENLVGSRPTDICILSVWQALRYCFHFPHARRSFVRDIMPWCCSRGEAISGSSPSESGRMPREPHEVGKCRVPVLCSESACRALPRVGPVRRAWQGGIW